MSQYRDQLDAALARIETLEAKLKERDASLLARDAELYEIRGEIARQRGDQGGSPDGLDARNGQRALLVALAVCGFVTATGYAMMRPRHCSTRGALYRPPTAAPAQAATTIGLPRSADEASDRCGSRRLRQMSP